MIKIEIKRIEKQMKTILPDHWGIREYKKIKLDDFQRVIPIGDNNDQFRKLVINAIKNATETVMLSSFILSDEEIISEILEASSRQVRCYLLFSTEAQLSKEFKEKLSEFDQETLNSHIEMLNALVGKVLARTNDHLHAKFLLVDYGTSNAKGFISTANFTLEALDRNQEIGIVLESTELTNVFEFFRLGFWKESKYELIRRKHWDALKRLEVPFKRGISRIYTTHTVCTDLKGSILEIIENASKSLIISSYGFEENHEVIMRLAEKAENLDLTILTRPRKKNYPTIKMLKEKGAKIFAYPYLHAKFVLDTQKNRGIIMTSNLERRGMDEGFEIGIEVTGYEATELKNIAKLWIDNAPYVWSNQISIHDQEFSIIKILEKGELMEKEILDDLLIELPDEKPDDLRRMRKILEEPLGKFPVPKNRFPRKVIVQKRIIPPTLPSEAIEVDFSKLIKKSKEIQEDAKPKKVKFPFETYQLKSKYYVVVSYWSDFDKIKSLPELKDSVLYVTKAKNR